MLLYVNTFAQGDSLCIVKLWKTELSQNLMKIIYVNEMRNF